MASPLTPVMSSQYSMHLHIHLIQRLLHMLDMLTRRFHQAMAMP
jgi:hypothetical protein